VEISDFRKKKPTFYDRSPNWLMVPQSNTSGRRLKKILERLLLFRSGKVRRKAQQQ
jgi:hypothetical protein